MDWLNCVSYFFGGVFLFNAVPIKRRRSATPSNPRRRSWTFARFSIRSRESSPHRWSWREQGNRLRPRKAVFHKTKCACADSWSVGEPPVIHVYRLSPRMPKKRLFSGRRVAEDPTGPGSVPERNIRSTQRVGVPRANESENESTRRGCHGMPQAVEISAAVGLPAALRGCQMLK